MASKKVKVRSLSRHSSLYNKQWAADQKDNMGTMHRQITLIIPETDAEGKPKGKDREITVWANGAPATVGDNKALAVPPHYCEWIRLLLAAYHSGSTSKGDGYALSVAGNIAEFEKDTITPLIEKGAVIESVFGDKETKLRATFEQLFTVAVLRANILQQTAERWPEEKEVVKEQAAEPEPVEVAFSL